MIPIILAVAEGEHAPNMLEQFGVYWTHFIAQLLTFLIVLWVLKKFAYTPILAMLEERKKRIADSMAQAEQIKQELANAQQARDRMLTEASAQAQKFVEEARAAAQREGDKRLQQAIAQAEALIAKAREATEQDRDRMMTELKREIGRLVIETTAKVSGKVLTPEDQRRLAEETARSLAA